MHLAVEEITESRTHEERRRIRMAAASELLNHVGDASAMVTLEGPDVIAKAVEEVLRRTEALNDSVRYYQVDCGRIPRTNSTALCRSAWTSSSRKLRPT